jgi:hypothetical protein
MTKLSTPTTIPRIFPKSLRDWTGADWIALAIMNFGGLNEASKAFGIDRRRLLRWTKIGLGHLPTWRTYQLSEITGIPVENLAIRVRQASRAA